jgi:hypothetical protein
MNYKVASSLSEVLSAWCLVYKQYMAASLIGPNKISIFTFPEYISNNTAVILGEKMGHTVCTVSGVLDSDKGLPLDSQYGAELQELRLAGKKLIEIGLLADARGTTNITHIIDLLAGIARFGVFSDHHDYVIGINPKRSNFFRTVFGFNVISEAKSYNKLQTAPVVLMHANGLQLETASLKTPYTIYNDPKKFNFAKRFRFNPDNFISNNEIDITKDTLINSIWNTTTPQFA